MHPRELVELAGIVAYCGPRVVSGAQSANLPFIEQYWAAAKSRDEAWCRSLADGARLACRETEKADATRGRVAATIEEIFTSELLARVWTAVLVAHDRKIEDNAYAPIARNLLAAHVEARHRAMALLVDGRLLDTETSVRLNRARRSAERWSDVLIGGLLKFADVRDLACDPERARDFACDLAGRRSDPDGRQAWRLTLTSLSRAYQSTSDRPAANPDANARVAASILAYYPSEAFDSTGLFKSLWLMRLKVGAIDAQGLIGELLKPGAGRHGGRLQWPRPKS